ncbi:copper transporter [Actinoplanes sp. NPDC051470]|uniref:copper transporter n=1 Tax=unclassified Actinoplanes TaxID=2626549 RepID=UPI00341D3B2F
MINFRYHVVSLTAVFLALAIGLVVGTAALNGPVADSLKEQVQSVSKDNSNLRDQQNQYRDELRRAQVFSTEVAPALLNGKLTGRKILVLALPNTQKYADQVIAMLQVAGATITAKVSVQEKFFEPVNGVELLDLAEQASQPTVPAAGLPMNSDGVETSSALLARALQQQPAPVSAADLTSVLAAYAEPGYIAADEVDGKAPAGGAEATVIVSALPPTDTDAAKKSQNAVMLTTQFAGDDRPLVVAGDGAVDGNLVAEVRADPILVKQISTVDNASSAQGQLATALCVVERVVQAKVGQYGLAAGATSLVPKAAA